MDNSSSRKLSRSGSLRGSVMDHLVATVAEHVHNLSGERVAAEASSSNAKNDKSADNSNNKQRTSFPFAVVGSSNPSLDVSTILWIFPQKFKSETIQNGFLLTEKDVKNGRMLMVVGAGHNHNNNNDRTHQSNNSNNHNNTSSSRPVVTWKNATFVCAEREIIIAAERCRGKAATVFLREIIQVSQNKSATLCVIRLSGGGNLVLTSRILLKTSLGRDAFCDFCQSRERLEAIERKSQEQDEGEDLLKSLEEEFDVHRQQRRASTNLNMHNSPRLNSTDNTDSNSHSSGMMIHSSDDEDLSLEGFENLMHQDFPTLGLSLQRKHGFLQRDVPINSKSPITFETDLFAGKLNILMRPQQPEDSPFFFEQVGEDTPVRFVLQIQGKFKYNPQGVVYAGFELQDEPQSSLVAQTWCSVLLKKMRDKYPNCHCSFGDDGEKAHMVAPAWTFFDRLVVTRETGAEAPPIDELFPEPQGSVDARQVSRSTGAWLMNQTYSFASYTEYIDFPTWSLVNLGSEDGNLDMHTLFAESSLKLVLYEHRDTTVAPAQHLQVHNHYLFSLKLQYRANSDDLYKTEEEETVQVSETISDTSTATAATSGSEEDVESSELEVLDEGPLVVELPQAILPSKDILEIANAACPAWIEVIEGGEPAKYQKYYVFTEDDESVVFRTPSAFKTFLDFQEAAKYVKECSSPRISDSESTRRILGYAFARGLQQNFAKTKRLTSRKSTVDQQFLLQRDDIDPVNPNTSHDVLKTCFVARALSERHWREEYMRLFEDRIDFYHPLRSEPHFSIYGSTVLRATCLEDTNSPHFPGYFVLEVEVLGRSNCIMYSSARQREKWAAIFQEFAQNNAEAFTGELLDGIESPMKEFSHKSSIWNCQQRRVLNSRRLKFGVPTKDLDPTSIVEKALLRISLVQEDPYDQKFIISFLDTVALLKDVDVYCLTEKERLAFFLNVYNLLTMHAQLIMGLPHSSEEKTAMLQMASYEISDDIVSLKELEHCILRAPMSFPSARAAVFRVPKTRYGFALETADYRINFCLASRHPVPIYDAAVLDLQLDSVALLELERANVERPTNNSSSAVTVTLPMSMWNYRFDFGTNVMEALTKIDNYLTPKSRSVLRTFRQGKGRKRVTVTYVPPISPITAAGVPAAGRSNGRMMRLDDKTREDIYADN